MVLRNVKIVIRSAIVDGVIRRMMKWRREKLLGNRFGLADQLWNQFCPFDSGEALVKTEEAIG